MLGAFSFSTSDTQALPGVTSSHRICNICMPLALPGTQTLKCFDIGFNCV